MNELDVITCADALEYMRGLPDKSVDALISDPPYNMTNLAWEQSIDWVTFWREARRILNRKNAPVILFSQQPFTTDLIMSNRKGFRYELIWHKTMAVGIFDANKRPLRSHENLLVFGDRMPDYYPQKETVTIRHSSSVRSGKIDHYNSKTKRVGKYEDDGSRYPRSVWTFAQRDTAFDLTTSLHPTQKPLPLIEKLLLTYTQPDDVILDCFMGSGTTAMAARKTGRHFIGCDLNPSYVTLAQRRLANTDPYQDKEYPDGNKQLSLFAMDEARKMP